MEYFDSSGKNTTKSGVIQITKAIEALVISTDVAFADLTTEQIKISVQRLNGSNEDITEGGFMSVRDFFLLTGAGTAAITTDVDGKLSVRCDLTPGGNFQLADKEELRVELMGLKTANTWIVDADETFADTNLYYRFGQKIIGDNQKQQAFALSHCDLMVLDNSTKIVDARFAWVNGRTTTHTTRELRAIQRQTDPIAGITAAGVVQTAYSDKIQLTLEGVDSIEFNKLGGAGTTVNLFVREKISA